jgi:folylpolyglutamate synthase/dihydropteroate synthase
MDVIGDTVEHIAAEKSGVIKKGIPCVIGPTCHEM